MLAKDKDLGIRDVLIVRVCKERRGVAERYTAHCVSLRVHERSVRLRLVRGVEDEKDDRVISSVENVYAVSMLNETREIQVSGLLVGPIVAYQLHLRRMRGRNIGYANRMDEVWTHDCAILKRCARTKSKDRLSWSQVNVAITVFKFVFRWSAVLCRCSVD